MKALVGFLLVVLLMVALLPLLDVPAGAIPDGRAAAGGSVGAITGGAAGGSGGIPGVPAHGLAGGTGGRHRCPCWCQLVTAVVSPVGAPQMVSLVCVLPLPPPMAARVALCVTHRSRWALACPESSRPPGGAVRPLEAPSGRK